MVDRLASRTPTLDAVLHALIDPERTEFEIRHLDLGRDRSVWLAALRREIAGLSAREKAHHGFTISATTAEVEFLTIAASLRAQSLEEYVKRAINAAMRKQGVDAVLFKESDDE